MVWMVHSCCMFKNKSIEYFLNTTTIGLRQGRDGLGVILDNLGWNLSDKGNLSPKYVWSYKVEILCLRTFLSETNWWIVSWVVFAFDASQDKTLLGVVVRRMWNSFGHRSLYTD